MKVNFLKLAEQELYDAQDYYEKQQEKLGYTFKNVVFNSLNRIIDFPEVYIKVKSDVRRCVIHKFPYNILYSIEDNHILIIAIAHQHRKPDYWLDRVK
jgi:plasmid stabilization system protein ParE